MLNEPNFKPSSRLRAYWMCLPQKTITVGSTQFPSLFNDLKPFFFQNFFFIIFIVLEVYSIFSFAHRGLDINIMLLLAIGEVVIALIPLMFEMVSTENCMAWVNSHLYITKIKMLYSNPSLIDNNADLAVDLSKWRSRKNRIILVYGFISALIILMGFSKFYIYYQIYGFELVNMQIGRLLLLSIIVGIITHLWCTKVVFLNLILKFKESSEISKKRSGRVDFLYNSNLTEYKAYQPDISTIQGYTDGGLKFRNAISSQLLAVRNYDGSNVGDGSFILRQYNKIGGGVGMYVDGNVTFSHDLILLNNQFVSDNHLGVIVNQQSGIKEKELLACYIREHQLND